MSSSPNLAGAIQANGAMFRLLRTQFKGLTGPLGLALISLTFPNPLLTQVKYPILSSIIKVIQGTMLGMRWQEDEVWNEK